MSNVVTLNVPGPQERRAAALGAMIRSFCSLRRSPEDVFWLKENGELLNILECTGQSVPARFLEAYAGFYTSVEEKLAFFPQYYRFLLSITLDLEALGLPGNKAESLCRWAFDQDLAGGETSDIQRLEARRLMQRRGFDPLEGRDDVEERLRGFISRPNRFALPNKKAAFELTHIVFYLSDYGREDPLLCPNGLRSLENAGILAFLDGNLDLLAEICVAMRYAGHNPSETWENWVSQKVKDIDVQEQDAADMKPAPVADQYHEYLTSNWMLGARGDSVFQAAAAQIGTARSRPDTRLSFHRSASGAGALREMTLQLFRMGEERAPDWTRMRDRIDPALSDAARSHLGQAVAASPDFGAFFEDFARARRVGG